jgi:Uma2 family endonuclease
MPRPGSVHKLTFRDYLGFPDDGNRHELIGGKHVVTPAPVRRHQRVAARLVISLGGFASRSGGGEVLFAPVDLVLSPHDVVQPDILFYAADHVDRIEARGVPNAPDVPDLAVEILSPGTARRDRGRKRQLYERAAVREYWIVDPDRCQVTVHRLQDGRYDGGSWLSLEKGDSLSTSLVPGWSLPLADLLRFDA